MTEMNEEQSQKMMKNDVVNTSESTVSDNIEIDKQDSNKENKIDEIRTTDNDKIYDINEIDKIVVSKEIDKVKLIVTLRYDTLKEFKQNVFKRYGIDKNLNNELEKLFFDYGTNFGIQQHATSSLLYEGRKPRKDVSLRLLDISSRLRSSNSHPCPSKLEVKKVVDMCLENADVRTRKKYFKCIKYFVESTTGRKLNYYDYWNLSGFHDAVMQKLSELQ